jgi:hypothetical protein
MKPYSIIIGIGLLFASCSIKQDVVGKYMSPNNPNYLQLRKDSTFIYEYRAMHLYQQSVGRWEKHNDGLVTLNSPIKSTIIPINVNNKRTASGNDITIKLNIHDSKSLADYMCRVYINNVVYCVKRCDSLTSIPISSPIENMYFMFIKAPQEITNTYVSLPLITTKYNPESKNGNSFEVKADFSDAYFYYKAFNNDTLKVKHNAIKIFNSNKGKWEKLLRVSDATNLFSRYNDKSTELNMIH